MKNPHPAKRICAGGTAKRFCREERGIKSEEWGGPECAGLEKGGFLHMMKALEGKVENTLWQERGKGEPQIKNGSMIVKVGCWAVLRCDVRARMRRVSKRTRDEGVKVEAYSWGDSRGSSRGSVYTHTTTPIFTPVDRYPSIGHAFHFHRNALSHFHRVECDEYTMSRM